MIRILAFCKTSRTKKEILAHVKLRPVYLNYCRHVRPLINSGLLDMTIPDKPNSRLQKYKLTAKGRAVIMNVQTK